MGELGGMAGWARQVLGNEADDREGELVDGEEEAEGGSAAERLTYQVKMTKMMILSSL